MTIVAGSAIPKYFQLQLSLRERIESRQWKPRERIPAERELCRTYGVSRATVRQALEALAREGLIGRRQGSGSYVAAPRVEQSLASLYSFTAEMLKRGLRPSLRVLGTRALPAPPSVAERLEIPVGQEVYWLVRLRLVNGDPWLLERSFLVAAYCPGLLEEDLSTRLLHDLFAQKYARPFARQRKWVEPVIVDGDSTAHLGVPAGAAALRIERITYSLRDEPLELREILVRADRCRYVIEVSRP